MAAAAAAAGGQVLHVEAPLPDLFVLPPEFLVGHAHVIDLNDVLAGSYGALAQQVSCIHGRSDLRPTARDRRSYDRETTGFAVELGRMRMNITRQKAEIRAVGGDPFPIPAQLNEAVNTLLAEAAGAALAQKNGDAARRLNAIIDVIAAEEAAEEAAAAAAAALNAVEEVAAAPAEVEEAAAAAALNEEVAALNEEVAALNVEA